MDLGLVVVSWNVRDLLAACLESALADLARSGLQGRVWVVDNASLDGSAALVAERFPQVELIANDRNLGFAAANNQALRAMGFNTPQDTSHKTHDTRHKPHFPPPSPRAPRPTPHASRPSPLHPLPSTAPDAALLLNPDTLIQPGALRALADFLRQTPDAGVLGARLVNPDGTPQECAFDFPGLWQAAFDLFPPSGPLARLAQSRLNGRYPPRLFEGGAPFRIGHPLGAAFLARGEAIAQAGLLDEGYHMYCEEIDWAWRMRRLGWQAYCVPQAVVVHYGGQSAAQVRAESFVNLWRSRKRLYETHRGRLAARLVGLLVRRAMRRRARRADAPEPYLEVARLWR